MRASRQWNLGLTSPQAQPLWNGWAKGISRKHDRCPQTNIPVPDRDSVEDPSRRVSSIFFLAFTCDPYSPSITPRGRCDLLEAVLLLLTCPVLTPKIGTSRFGMAHFRPPSEPGVHPSSPQLGQLVLSAANCIFCALTICTSMTPHRRYRKSCVHYATA